MLVLYLLNDFYCCCCFDKVGITDGFVRVSCGIEDTEDLLNTLSAALDNI